MGTKYQEDNFTISSSLDDPEWDAFVATTEGGHHVQTSLWAQVKAQLGWKPLRIILRHQDNMVAGCQILVRHYPILGNIGVVPKGPLCRIEDPKTIEKIIEKLIWICKVYKIKIIAVQPPDNGEYIGHKLAENNFRPSTVELASPATIIIDISIDESHLLNKFKKQTRKNINISKRAGVIVREGTEEDLHTFYDLHVNTSKRQKFLPFPESYFEAMYRILGPHGYIKLLFAEIQGETVSAGLVILFRDTVIFKFIGWSGKYKKAKPNNALDWGVFLWAKNHDYHYVDLEGVNLEGARKFLKGEPLPESSRAGYDLQKYGYGGKVVIFPEPYDMIFNPIYRWLFHRIKLQVTQPNPFSKIIDLFRKR